MAAVVVQGRTDALGIGMSAGQAASSETSAPRRAHWTLPVRATLSVTVPLGLLQGAVAAYLLMSGAASLNLVLAIVAASLVCTAVVAIVTWRGARNVARRLQVVIDQMQRIQDGDYRARVPVDVADELGLLAHRANRLAMSAAAREKRILENALLDPLTGLYNRTLLIDRIRAHIGEAQRTKARFCVAVLDLDRFKVVNDTLGHTVGDMVLKEVARRLKKAVRDSDTVARLGGDEFVLLLDGGLDVGREITERIRKAMSVPLRDGDQIIDIGLSAGLAAYPEHGQDDETLLRHADSAMYRAKHNGLGMCVFDGDSKETHRSYLSMLGELRAALIKGQFVLEYQPKLDLRSGLTVGLEGLIRWNHPVRGRVQPNEFIPFAEQTGFMRDITRWVLMEGATFAAQMQKAKLDLCVSVNVSAQDIQDPEFCAVVGEVLAQTRLEPRRLCLEITESGVVSETEAALENLKTIAGWGVKLSVDDFGTGYATLKQLQRLPVHELKIDRSFVSGLPTNRGNESIVHATIDLARQLGLSVVAEGVETVNELRVLAAMGCNQAQGYYLSKSMPASEVEAWVSIRHSLHESSRELYFEMLTSK